MSILFHRFRLIVLVLGCTCWCAAAAGAQNTPPADSSGDAQKEATNTGDSKVVEKPADGQQPGSSEEAANRDGAGDSRDPAEDGDSDEERRKRFPLIRNLRVEQDPKFPHSYRLRWDVDAKNDTAIYVGRYIRPLSTRELILEAENLTSPPLGPQSKEYLDRDIPDGAYYYVVVTTYEMSKRSAVVLQPNVNNTTNASVVYREPGEANANKQPGGTENGESAKPATEQPVEISNLYAVNSGDSVKLSWRPPGGTRPVRYNIYRSERSLDGPDALRSATRLAVVAGREYTYEDRSPVDGRRVYYGVSVTDEQTGKENERLYFQKSFVEHTFEKPRENATPAAGESLPDALTAFLAGRDSVRLLWVAPRGQAPRDYRVYRSPRPIASPAALSGASFLGVTQGGTTGYRDERLAPGTYYYAVLPRDQRGVEQRVFVEGRTFTGFAVNISAASDAQEPGNGTNNGSGDSGGSDNSGESAEAQEKRPRPANFSARAGFDGDAVTLTWKIESPSEAKANDSEVEFQQLRFRSRKPMRAIAEIRARGARVATLTGEEREFVDRSVRPGRYHYALVLDFGDRVSDKLFVGRHYLRFPVELVAPNTLGEDAEPELRDASLDELNRVLAATYHRQRYGQTVSRVAPFVNGADVAPNVRAKAMLYTGLALYHSGDYRNSINYFLQAQVREYYPERAEFWYNRSIKRMR